MEDNKSECNEKGVPISEKNSVYEDNVSEYYAQKNNTMKGKLVIKILEYGNVSKTNFNYNLYSNLCGVNPIKKDGFSTTSKINNREMDRLQKNKEAREEYFRNVTGIF